ncbi:MAG: hypothetical protein ACREA7_06260 [Nitrosotalea sp.]
MLSSFFSLPYVIKPANAMQGLIPQLEPVGHTSSNPNLYVSAENPLFKNYFAGPMVIEVIVSDPNISRLDQVYGEPVVTVNGKRLRMAQGTDGNWYGYFADRNQAMAAANTAVLSGKGLNFGGFCSSSSTLSPKSGVGYSQTTGFTIARGGFDSVNHTNNLALPNLVTLTSSGLPVCSNAPGTLTGDKMEHVIRENKTLNMNVNGFSANDIYEEIWPVIQLYDFSAIPTPITVDYQAAGGDQIVNLIFDRIPSNLIHVYADRPDFPQGAQVQGDLVDPQLNIDPTDVDSWTWGTSPTNNTLYYMAFDQNGRPDADGTLAMQNLIGNLTTFMFNHNGRLLEDASPQGVVVGKLQSNGIQTLFPDNTLPKPYTGLLRTESISALSIPITGCELEPNAGIFSSYDNGGISDIVILDKAPRDKSFTITYNDVSYSIIVKFHDAKLTMGW